MKQQLIHLTLAILFLLFAIVQWNDPDGYIWIPAYLIVVVIAGLAYKGKFYHKKYLFILFALTLWWASYLPDFARWMTDGTPNIAGSMKAESPYIELVREFFGLLICIITIAYYYIISKRKSNA